MLFDTNIILDVFTDDPAWAEWSAQRLAEADRRLINPVVYAELSSRFPDPRQLETELDLLEITFAEIPKRALHRAGRCLREYRRAEGRRERVLADVLIGAHAEDLQVPLVTRNPRDFRTYFPGLEVVAPQS